jgi:hypothetical protein
VKPVSLNEFIAKANAKHNHKYSYIKSIYINNYSDIEIVCPIHGSFWQTPKNHYRFGCKGCSDDEKSMGAYKFIQISSIIHNNKYTYLNVIYKNNKAYVIIACPIHGDFKQNPTSHINGHGCRRCYDAKPKKHKISLEKFTEVSSIIHNNKYSYSETILGKNNKCLISIICPIHGIFYQEMRAHMYGCGCWDCSGRKKLTTEKFIEKANRVHNFRYIYVDTIYFNAYTKVNIICPKHGLFLQVAQDHLSGHGCKSCFKTVSKLETEWLDYLKVRQGQQYRNVYINFGQKRYNVDGFEPITNTIYEFYGDFWHGNPIIFEKDDMNLVNKTKFGDLFNKTIKREKEIKQYGYNLITIWETDWKRLKLNLTDI